MDKKTHYLRYAYEKSDGSTSQIKHIYQELIPVKNYTTIQSDKYLCGLKVSKFINLSDFAAVENFIPNFNADDDTTLCSKCKSIMDNLFPKL